MKNSAYSSQLTVCRKNPGLSPATCHLPPASSRGFTLLIAIIFMSVMLSFGLALGALAYKQAVLASSAVQSQYAFYAADAGLECALYADQKGDVFAYPADPETPAPLMTCDATEPISASVISHTADQRVVSSRLSLDSGKRCADVTVYKPSSAGTTYVFSVGYDVSCETVANPSGARLSSRGLQAHYASGAPLPTQEWYSGITYSHSGIWHNCSIAPSEANMNDEVTDPKGTYGSSATNGWIVADLGAIKTIQTIRVGGWGPNNCEGDPENNWGPVQPKFQVSTDGNDWIDVADASDLLGGYSDTEMRDVTFSAVSARYARIVRDDGGWILLGQFRVGYLVP